MKENVSAFFVSHAKIELLWSKRHHGWCSVKIRIWDRWTIQRLKKNPQSVVEWTPEVVSVSFPFSYNLSCHLVNVFIASNYRQIWLPN